MWKQIIAEVKPNLVITTGTAGGIGKAFEVGDVVVSPIVRFDCTAKFKREPFRLAHFSSRPAKTTHFATAKNLFKANSALLPKDNKRQPKIVKVPTKALSKSIVTTDFFGSIHPTIITNCRVSETFRKWAMPCSVLFAMRWWRMRLVGLP